MYRRLKNLMRTNGITQKDIAAQLQKSPAYLSMRFTGARTFDGHEIASICRLLEIPIERNYDYFAESFR